MRVSDNTGLNVDLIVVSNGEDETKSFLEKEIISDAGDKLIVSNVVSCLIKMMSFVNRQDEFEDLAPNGEDYVMINNKKFKCNKINKI